MLRTDLCTEIIDSKALIQYLCAESVAFWAGTLQYKNSEPDLITDDSLGGWLDSVLECVFANVPQPQRPPVEF